MTRLGLVAAVSLLAPVLAACGGPQDVVVGEDYQRVLDPLPRELRALDVLFVVDTSGSMLAEQQALVSSAGAQLFGQLESDLGGMPDLHVAVVSTNVGVGQSGVPSCPAVNDDGRFRIGAEGASCPITGRFLSDVAAADGSRITNYTGRLQDAFTCAASLGTTGCGFEQPFEAVRRALDGRYPEHAGFMREGALLLVVFLTDEDDCSAFDTRVYGRPGDGINSPLGPQTSLRCFEFGVVCDPDAPRVDGEKRDCRPREDSEYITPVAEVASFLRALKPQSSMLMLAGMYAPPEPVVVGPDAQGLPTLLPTCAAPATGVEATPAIRLAALIGEFPSRFVFESLCDATMSERLNRVTRSATGVMKQKPCLLGRLDAATTTQRCRAFDVAPDGSERAVGGCRSQNDVGCFVVAPSAQCDYTPSGVAATFRGTLAAGHRLVVDCLAPASR